MFTFGREHERKCAAQYIRNRADIALIEEVVDAVHDVIEQKVPLDSIREFLARAFSTGGSGAWEQTGSWLRKLATKHPDVESWWRELSQSPDGKVRFRVAAFLNELPRPLAVELGNRLKADPHKKTREMAIARLEEIGNSPDAAS